MKSREQRKADTLIDVLNLLAKENTKGVWVGKNYSLNQLRNDLQSILSQQYLKELTKQAQEWKMYEMDYWMQHTLNDNLSSLYEE